MFKDHFVQLFKYNDWATKKAADSIIRSESKDEKIIKLLSHIVNSQRIWLDRILKKDVMTDPFRMHSTEECVEQSHHITFEWISFLENLDEAGLRKQIQYKNNKGDYWENTIGDIVTHIINHSTYHRAQLMRQSGDQPPKTDYIVYQRQFQK